MPSGGGRHAGRIYGFPLGGKCFINRDCKVAPIRKYLAGIAGSSRAVRQNIVQYIGIAADEPRRLAKLTENRMSLLAKYGYTERMAKQLCSDHGLLSPIYATGTRGGCGSCALFADEDDEGQGWCELHQEHVSYIDRCDDRVSKV